MTIDNLTKTVFGALLGFLTAVMTWMVRSTSRNRETSLVNKMKQEALEKRVGDLEEKALTKESVREVIENALAKRDAIAVERRAEWNEHLALQLKQAVAEGIQVCKVLCKKDIQQDVKMAVDEAFRQRDP